jgi:hypothetical protein
MPAREKLRARGKAPRREHKPFYESPAWEPSELLQKHLLPALQRSGTHLPSHSRHDVLDLQRAIGNRAVTALLAAPKHAGSGQHARGVTSVVQRVDFRMLTKQADKDKYLKYEQWVKDHNATYSAFSVNFATINASSKTVAELGKNVVLAIKKAAAKAEEMIAKSKPIGSVDFSQLVEIPSEKTVEVPKVILTPKAPKIVSEKEKQEQEVLTSMFKAKPTVQRYDTVMDVTNLHIRTFAEAPGRPPGIAGIMNGYSAVTENTVYFPIRLVRTLSPTATEIYNFEIHYHPSKTGNWLHPKRTAGATPEHQIGSAHWMIDLGLLDAGRVAFDQFNKTTSPTL